MQAIMSVRPPEALRDKLKAIAEKKGLTVNALVISIFWDFVEKTSKENRDE